MGMTKEGWVKRKLNGNGDPWNKDKKCPERSGKNCNLWRGGTVVIKCYECSKEFFVYQYRKNTAHFCSQACSHKNRNQGKSLENDILRRCAEYRLWRKAVFERDDYTCQECGIRNGQGRTIYLHADHIKPFSLFPDLRFAIDNGRTLCVPCHKKTETFGFKAWRNK